MLSVFTEILGHWVVPFKNFVRQFHPISKMTTTGEHSLTLDTMGNYFKNLIRNYLANWNQTRSQWSLYGPLQNCVRHFDPSSEMALLRHSLKLDFFFKFIFSGICNQSFWSLNTSIYYVVCKSVWKLGERYRVRFLILFHIYDPNIKVAYLVIKNKWNNTENRNSVLHVW